MNEQNEQQLATLRSVIASALSTRTLRKLILSRPTNKSHIRTTGVLFERAGDLLLQLETLMRDGKALHENLSLEAAPSRVCELLSSHGQLDILTTGGSCVVMRSKKGSLHITNNIKGGEAIEIAGHDRAKTHILDGSEPFLIGLGVSDSSGRVNDRMRPKFRQINRFLELLADVYDELPPPPNKLLVYDLCCGKSYLTFAVWHYLSVIKEREVEMYGVDLKPDVIEYCSALAARLGFDSLRFRCGNVAELEVTERPALVVSLHACDVATDYVLCGAIRSGARVILSTPCCHHEMMKQLSSPELAFIRHSILKQKLCDAATDSLRALRLELEGYDVAALELVDPEETPKNVMLRAVKRGISAEARTRKREEYDAAVKLLGVDPMLDRLLREKTQSNN